MNSIKFKFKAGIENFTAWSLLPTIRFGKLRSGHGGFVAFTFLKFDACLTWEFKEWANGKDPHRPGVKLDAGKPRMGLVFNGFPLALLEIGKVATFGAAKYTDNGWVEVENGVERYTDAMYRHQLAEATDQWLDDESGLAHAAHAAWCALARLELLLREVAE